MKKIIVAFNIIISLLSVGIIFIDLRFMAIPKWISLIAMIVLLAFIVFEWIKGKHLFGKIIFSVINILVLIITFIGTYCNPYRNSMTLYQNPDYYCKEYKTEMSYDEAKADLDEAMQYLKNIHPMFIHGFTPDVQELYNQALSHLQRSKGISVNDLCKEIETVFSSLNDGHTHIDARYSDYHYLKDIHAHSLAHDEIVAVNNITLEEIFEKNRNYFSYETEEYGLRKIKACLQTIEDLNYIGFNIDDGITYTYMDSNGDLFDEKYYAKDFLTDEEYREYNNMDNLEDDESDDEYKFVEYEILKSANMAVLTLHSCEYNDEYKKCLSDMFREVKERGIDNVCVDLRDNSGGNSYVADEFIHYLDVDSYCTWGQDWRLGLILIPSNGSVLKNHKYTDFLFSGNVYMLTSIDSFSSAMDFAMLISDNKLGKIVGEHSGNKPRSYGDISIFKLRNSGLVMQVSTKKWYRVDETNKDEFVEPDIACDSEQALQVLMEHLKE